MLPARLITGLCLYPVSHIWRIFQGCSVRIEESVPKDIVCLTSRSLQDSDPKGRIFLNTQHSKKILLLVLLPISNVCWSFSFLTQHSLRYRMKLNSAVLKVVLSLLRRDDVSLATELRGVLHNQNIDRSGVNVFLFVLFVLPLGRKGG